MKQFLSKQSVAVSLCCLVCLCGAATAQSYRALWEQGRYDEAHAEVEALLLQDEGVYLPHKLDAAALRFEVGKVDAAIALMEEVVEAYPLPSSSVRLARLYRYRGRQADYEAALERAERQVRVLINYRLDGEEWVAIGQLMEMQGEDAQAVLAHYGRLAERYPEYAPGWVAAGDLAYARRADDVAAAKYQRALAVDADDQRALAGLAATYRRSGDPRLAEALEQLRRRNPQHPRARLITAEQALEQGRAAAAVAVLDSVLQINPNHTEALALLGAARWLDDDEAAAAALRQRILAFNPGASAAYRVSGRVASRHYRFAAGRDFQRRALEVDPDDTEARLLLAFDLLRLGEEEEAVAQLERAFAADPYRVEAYNLLGVADAMEGFETVRRGLFELRLPPLEAQVLAGDMLDLLEAAAELYQGLYDIRLQGPIKVQVFDDHDEFMVRSVGLPGNAGHLGICFGRVVTMDSPRARPPGAMDWRQVLWHEFVHVITLEKTGNRLPRWLSEGISVFEEQRREASWGQRLEADFAAVWSVGQAPDLEQLDGFFTRPASPAELMFGYFAAGEFIHCYVGAYGIDALAEALDAIGIGTAPAAALEAAAGQGLAEILARYGRHMEKRCAPLGRTEAFEATLKEGRQAEVVGQVQTAAAAYRRAYGLNAEYDAADAPLRRLVALYEAAADTAAYRRALHELVAWDGTAYAEGLVLARMHAEGGEYDAASEVLQRVAGAVPFRPDIALLQARYAEAAQAYGRAAAQYGRLQHLEPARRTEYRLRQARALARDRQTGAAKAQVLALLEEMPHFDQAQELLLQLVDGEGF